MESIGLVYNKDKVSLAILKDYGISISYDMIAGLIAKARMYGETEIARIPHTLMLDTKKVFENDPLSNIIMQNMELFAPDGIINFQAF
jgi:hypothetical protein